MTSVDPATFIHVPEPEFARHLGYPDETIPGGRSREVADGARLWFMSHARPWYASRIVPIEHVNDATVSLRTGMQFESSVLAGRLREARCHSVLALAVSVGKEVESEIKASWADDRPDDSYALNAYAASATEQLLLAAGKVWCDRAEKTGDTLLQHYSPGYEGWDIADQALVMSLLKAVHDDLRLDLLESALLTPQKSMLAVFGITSDLDAVPPALVPCTTCAMPGCSLRRLPFEAPPSSPPPSACQPELPAVPSLDSIPPPPSRAHGYAFPLKALKRWSSQLLELEPAGDGRIRARFTYNGSTCSDGGIPLAFLYEVRLERSGDEFIISEMGCQPQNGDQGHRETCSFQINPRNARSHYENFKPLLGSPLSAAVSWNPQRNPAGCLCTPANRNHKWLMALQTIHFALNTEWSGTASRAEASHSSETSTSWIRKGKPFRS